MYYLEPQAVNFKIQHLNKYPSFHHCSVPITTQNRLYRNISLLFHIYGIYRMCDLKYLHKHQSALVQIFSGGVLFTRLLPVGVFAALCFSSCSLESCRTKAPHFVRKQFRDRSSHNFVKQDSKSKTNTGIKSLMQRGLMSNVTVLHAAGKQL